MKYLLLCAILVAQPAPVFGTDRPALESLEQNIGKAINGFAFRLYQEVAEGQNDCTISPMSIHVALLMALEGARGETADEMKQALGLGGNTEAILKAARLMLDRLRNRQKELELNIVNEMWGQSGHPFEDAYKKALADAFDAAINAVDFEADVEGARRKINAAVASATKQRITNLIPAGALTSATRLVLTNAIWFKASWATPFDPFLTSDAPFHMADGSKIDVPMMRRTGNVRYFEDEHVQVLKLGYHGRDMEMNVVLPKEGKDLAAIEKSLTPALWWTWTSGMALREVAIFLPRFKTQSGLRLASKLERMGMKRALTLGQADFSGIDGGAGQLLISEVFHRTWVKVTEAGTEAAAATGFVLLTGTNVGAEPQPVVFRADRPFLFVIRENKTGSILFLGRVHDPR